MGSSSSSRCGGILARIEGGCNSIVGCGVGSPRALEGWGRGIPLLRKERARMGHPRSVEGMGLGSCWKLCLGW